MNANPLPDDAFEIPDSTDWLATPLPSLAAVEAALRCQVCKDFYTTPMITSCSHTFCSLCIRRSLTHDGKCPACRAGDQEMKLRQNWAMEELVEAFKKARPEVLGFATRPVERSTSPKRKRVVEEGEDGSTPRRKRTRSGRRILPSSQIVALDSDGDDEDYTPEEEEPKDGLVPCPICQERMTVQAVEAHIDHCDGEPPSKKKGARNSTQNPTIHKAIKRPERLPHPHYSGLKDAALRKKLADQGISSSGSRQLMERRYTEWVTLWNANCDSKNPKGKSELRRDLDLWERTQGGRAVVSWKEQEIGSQIRDKDFDGKAWAEKNDEAFKQLIANARRKPAAKASSSGSGPAQGEAVDGPSVALRTLDRPHTEMVPRPSFDPSIQTSSLPQSGSTVSNEQPRATTSPVTYKGSQTRAFQEPSSPGHTGPLPSPQRQGTSTLDKDTAINPDRTTIKPLEP